MENIPVKLNALVNEYHYFEDNQVLTAQHLNNVIEFLDRRDRLTRTRLLGTGIVCGLEVSTDPASSQITITKGAAITTDGDLLHIDADTPYSRIRPFVDDNARYAPFRQAADTNAQIRLWQLFEADSEADNLSDLNDFAASNNFGNLAVVLYLNSFLQPPEDCTEVDCENKGPHQRATLTALLVNKADLDNIGLTAQNQYFQLPDIAIRKVDLTTGTINNRTTLLSRFNDAITTSRDELIDALAMSCSLYPELLNPAYNNSTPETRWRNRLNTIFNSSLNSQRPIATIKYDFMKDLAAAYSEFRETVFDLYVDCCPEPDHFAKHVMLSELVPDSDCRPASYRHYFSESPILNHKDRRVKKAQFLHQRIDAMISGFRLTRIPNLPIQITPSSYGDYSLGQKAIPFYYQHNDPQAYDMNRLWDFEARRRCQHNNLLGYHALRYSSSDAVTDPLAYCREDRNFYRIEGHLNKNIEAAEQEINNLRQEFNLDFKLETIQVEDSLPTIRLRPGRFKFPSIKFHFRNYREDLLDKLSSVDNFKNELSLKVQALSTSNDTTFNDAPEMRTELQNAGQETEELGQRIRQVKTMMYQPMQNFESNYTQFRSSYRTAVARTNSINNKVYYAAQTKMHNPLHSFVRNNKLGKFDRLVDLLKRKKDKVRQQLIFDTFYSNNTGLQHMGGVPRGGTFVLVYSATTNRVLADFSLPYESIIDADPEVEETAPQNGQVRPPVSFLPGTFTWIDKLDTVRDARVKRAVDNIRLIDQDFAKKSENFYRDIVQVATTAKGLPGSDTGSTNSFLDDITNREDLIAAMGGRNQIIRLLGGSSGLLGILGGQNGLLTAMGGRNGLIDAMGGQNGIINAAGGRIGLINAMGGRNGMYQALGGKDGLVQEMGGRNGMYQILGGQQGLVEFIGRDSFVGGNDMKFNVDGTRLFVLEGGGSRLRDGTLVVRGSAPPTPPSSNPLFTNINSLGILLHEMDSLDRRNTEQEMQFKALSKAYDTTVAALLNSISSLKKDIAVSSGLAQTLERLSMQKDQFSKDVRFTNSAKVLKDLKKKHARKPVLKSLLDKM